MSTSSECPGPRGPPLSLYHANSPYSSVGLLRPAGLLTLGFERIPIGCESDIPSEEISRCCPGLKSATLGNFSDDSREDVLSLILSPPLTRLALLEAIFL